MFELIKLFYEIALLRKAPQDIPASVVLQRLLVFVYAVISFLMLYMSINWFKALMQIGVSLVLVWGFCRLALYWAGKPERFLQTFSALIGIDTLLSFFMFPALAALTAPMPEGSELPVLGFFVYLGLILWNWVVTGHIMRHALSESFGFGLGVALLYLVVSYQVISLLFPEIAIE